MGNYPNAAGWKEGDTSRAAAKTIEASGRGRNLREQCLELFQTGWQGTSEEVSKRLQEHDLSIRPRLSELRGLGLLEPTGEKKRGMFGKDIHIWRLKSEQGVLPL
ncbi:MAG: hypothetical protein GY952_13925 [Rhodobacteraceae bacterium]|nr:hypothetical protein [Paracoccaceae bacterium]